MSQTPVRHPDPSPATVARGHEPDPLRVRPAVWMLVAFIAFAVVAHAGIWFLLKHEVKHARAVDRPRSVARPDPGPPPGAPVIQPSPQYDLVPSQDLAEMRAAEDRVFSEIGWPVKDGRATIPDAIVRAVASHPATRPTSGGVK